MCNKHQARYVPKISNTKLGLGSTNIPYEKNPTRGYGTIHIGILLMLPALMAWMGYDISLIITMPTANT